MIIKTENYEYVFPVENDVIVLIDNDYSKEVIKYLQTYFLSKRKNSFLIFDDDKNLINPNEFEFIYFSQKDNIQNNFLMKNKSVVNEFFTGLIENNVMNFLSIDRLRNNLNSLLTDDGTYKFTSIIQRDLGINIRLDFNCLSLPSILEMYYINDDELDYSTKVSMLYNVLLYENRDKQKFIYIDYKLNDNLVNWIYKSRDMNTIFIVNSKSLVDNTSFGNCDAIIQSNNEFVTRMHLDKKELNRLIYMSSEYIRLNMAYQKEENIQFIQNFINRDTTFCIKFSDNFY